MLQAQFLLFLSLAASRVTDLLTTTRLLTRKFILTTLCIFICFVVQNIIMLYNSWQLSFGTVSRRDTQHQLNTAWQTTQSSSISHSLLNLLPLSSVARCWLKNQPKCPHKTSPKPAQKTPN